MNQDQPMQTPPVADNQTPEPHGAPVWAQPQASHSWKRLPSINQLLFAASFGCLGLGALSLAGPPAVDAARGAYHPFTSEGKRESCVSNLQAIARAASLYADDNEVRFPLIEMKQGQKNITWVASLAPHVSDSKSWVCPQGATPSNEGSNYALNPVLAGGPASRADDPASTLLFADGNTPDELALQPPYPGWNKENATSSEAGLAFRHDGVANVVYADGHAETLDPGRVKEAALWGGSAAARASLERIAATSAGSQALIAKLKAGDEAGIALLLRTKAQDVATTSRDLLALWELNAQASLNENEAGTADTVSQSVDTLGWNLAWAWKRLGEEATLEKLEAHVATQAKAELERVKAAGLETRSGAGGATLSAPPGWTSDETTSGNYRTLNLRSRVPGLFLYVEVGTRSIPVPTPIPIDWRGAERRLKAKYGTGYRRISLGSGTLGGQLAGVWEYELDKPSGPRLHKRLVGSVNGWNSTVFATTTPRGSFETWKTTFDQVGNSLAKN